MDRWDMLMIAAAVYVAVFSLVKLMAVRRDQVVRQYQAEIERLQAERRAAEEAEVEAA